MIDYLLLLARRFPPLIWHETTIEDMSNIFNRSTRYTKTILKKLREEKWIEWQYFKGRGKKPQIYLTINEKEIIQLQFDTYWGCSQFDKAYELLHVHNLLQNKEVLNWIQQRYGVVSVESTTNKRDVFRYPYFHTDLKLDPLRVLSRHDAHFCEQLFETLFTYCPLSNTVQPNIAFAFETEDAKKWLIYLRKDVYFHDQTKLTSTDVVATLERAKEQMNEFVGIESIQALHDTCVQIITTNADFLLPRYLCALKLAIVPHQWIVKGEVGIPIGCGPFQLEEQSERSMRLTAFSYYFGHRAWIDEIEIIYTPDAVDFGLSKGPFEEHISQRKIEHLEPGADFILLNATKHSCLHDETLRHALYDAINPIAFCLFEQGEIVAHSFLLEATDTEGSNKNASTSFKVFPKLRIGTQQIRQHANHLREAEILCERLTQLNIEYEMEFVKIGMREEEAVKKYDIVVGGIALGKDALISLLFCLQSPQFYFTAFLPNELKEAFYSRIERMKTTRNLEEALDQYLFMEQQMKGSKVLKLLTHRKHQLFICEDSPFANINMDAHGNIDYLSIYKKVR